jgi:hypothetical protein
MSASRRALLAAAAAWVATGAVFAAAMSVPIADPPADGVGLRRFLTPEIGSRYAPSQTFVMAGDGLSAVAVRAAAVPGRDVGGRIRFELYDVTGGPPRLVRAADADAADVLSGDSFRFEFAPIPRSHRRRYRLDIVAADPARPTGVALRATKGDSYEGGALLINGTERWADLAFAAEAMLPSRWQALRARAGPGRAALALGLMTAQWLLIGIVLLAPSWRPRAPGRDA